MKSSDNYNNEKNARALMAKDTEPSLGELSTARRIRTERESRFNRSWLKERDVPGYIEFVKEEINFRAKALRYQAFEIGKLLYDVRELLPHGEFGSWLENNVPFSKSTALNFMRVYRTCLGTPELVEYFNPSVLYRVCRPNFPGDLRKELFANATGVYDLSEKELLEVAFKWKSGEVNLKSPEVQNLLRKQKNKEVSKRYQIELKALRELLRKRLQMIQSISKQHVVYPLMDEEGRAENKLGQEIEQMIEGFIGEVEGMLDALNQSQ